MVQVTNLTSKNYTLVFYKVAYCIHDDTQYKDGEINILMSRFHNILSEICFRSSCRE